MCAGRSMLRPYERVNCGRCRLALREADDAASLEVNVNFVVSGPSG